MGDELSLERQGLQGKIKFFMTLVCWLVQQWSNPSWTELSILISLSMSSLWSPRLLYMSKKFCVSVCLVAICTMWVERRDYQTIYLFVEFHKPPLVLSQLGPTGHSVNLTKKPLVWNKRRMTS